MKKFPSYLAILVGLLAVAAQVILYYLRFGHWNTVSPLLDYVFFFLAGLVGGWVLIFFVNRQTSAIRRWTVLAAFLLASPIALTLMVGGGLFGWPGVLLAPQVPWTLFTVLGAWLGKFVARE